MSNTAIIQKFTPGPWTIEKTHDIIWIGSTRDDDSLDELILHINQDASYKDEKKERNMANAKLIAAAPDMYAAIVKYLQAVEAGEITDELDGLKVAIEKLTQ